MRPVEKWAMRAVIALCCGVFAYWFLTGSIDDRRAWVVLFAGWIGYISLSKRLERIEEKMDGRR